MKDIDSDSTIAKSTSQGQILWGLWCRFYPLAMTDFAMTLGDVLRPVSLARLPHTEISLAAIGVIKSIAVFLESPIIMILHASTALSKNKKSHEALWTFTLFISGILTSIFLVLCFEPIYNWLFFELFAVSQEIAIAARASFYLMIPWPALIAIRRYYQGYLVRDRQEKSIATAGLIRLLFTVGVLWIGTLYNFDGTMVAAISLISAVAIETIVVVYYSRRSVEKYPLSEENHQIATTVTGVARFYAPLGSTSMLVWAARALIIGIIARAPDGLFGIAVWTAACGFILPIANATRMVQQIVISSTSIPEQTLLRFAYVVGGGCSVSLLVLGFTPFGISLVNVLLGNNDSIAHAIIPVMQISLLVPLMTAFQNTYQGFLIVMKAHWWINFATVVNAVISLALAAILIKLKHSGAWAAAIASLVGLSIEVVILVMCHRKNMRRV